MDKFIKLLLESENTVILPGFGAIVVGNESTGALMFNEYLKFNDGKLDAIIVEHSNMDIQEAQNYIAKHIREIQAEIDKGEEYSIFGLGSFSKDKDGSILFSGNKNEGSAGKKEEAVFAGPSPTPPKEEKIEQPQEPAIPEQTPTDKKDEGELKSEEKDKTTDKEEIKTPIQEEPIKKEAPKEPESIPVAQKSTVEKKKTTKENKYEDKAAPKEKAPDTNKKKRKRGFVFYLLLLILLVIAGGTTYIGLNYDEFKVMMGWDKFEEVKDPKTIIAEVEETSENEVSTTPTETVVTEDELDEETVEEEQLIAEYESTADELVEEIESPVSEPEPVEEIAPKEEVVQPAPTPVASSTSGNFYLIAGTFSDKSNAEKLVEELKSKGYPAEIIGFLNNMHYVSLQSFSSRSEANSAIQSVQSDAPKAWVYKKP